MPDVVRFFLGVCPLGGICFPIRGLLILMCRDVRCRGGQFLSSSDISGGALKNVRVGISSYVGVHEDVEGCGPSRVSRSVVSSVVSVTSCSPS